MIVLDKSVSFLDSAYPACIPYSLGNNPFVSYWIAAGYVSMVIAAVVLLLIAYC